MLRSRFARPVFALGLLVITFTMQTALSVAAPAPRVSNPDSKVPVDPCKTKPSASASRNPPGNGNSCHQSSRKADEKLPYQNSTDRLAQAGSAGLQTEAESQSAKKKAQSIYQNSGWFWLGGQANVVAQGHGGFHALYSGPNSFHNYREEDVTSIEDLFTGVRVTHNFQVIFDLEDVRGQGLSSVLGIAGFPDLDAQRAPSPGAGAVHTYMSRFLLHYIIPLGGGNVQNVPSYLELDSSLPARRIEIYFGKFSLADFFDHNGYANDDHSQFLNWTADQNGAWDFAANTSGYTYGGYMEFDDHNWSFRYAEVLMTKNPNGRYLDLHVASNKAENAQVNWAYSPSTSGKLRLLGFVDQASMGSFANALAAWRAGLTAVPELSFVRQRGAHEYGFGLNWQQGLPYGLGLFARAGWNNGKFESYSFTEVNNTFEGGLQLPGKLWGKPSDHIGVAYVTNGISSGHQQYLAAGGQGFILGDGGLTYGREQILEAYYNLKIGMGLSVAPDIQFIQNPGYNQVRGPVVIFGMRLHLHLGLHQIP